MPLVTARAASWVAVGVLIGALAMVCGASQVTAQGGGTEVPPEAVAAVARQLNCPICQGYNLQDCPLEVCAQMRELIREQLAQGQSAADVKAGFVEEYGPQVLNAPPTSGVFLGAWILPVVVLIGGALVVAAVVWRGAAHRAPDGARNGPVDPSATADDRYEDRLEQMLVRDDT